MNNKKFLSSDDFTFTRHKTIAEAASSMIASSTGRQRSRPIALKFSPQGLGARSNEVIAETPTACDAALADKNVVLVKKQNLTNAYIGEETTTTTTTLAPTVAATMTTNIVGGKLVQRNSSSTSKSSSNFEDEAFYSLDEQDVVVVGATAAATTATTATANNEQYKPKTTTTATTATANNEQYKPKTTTIATTPTTAMNSLTSRVAAKINETTNIYKSRRAANKTAKKRQKITPLAHNGAGKRAELYKEFSNERLGGVSSIVRQHSDRRPDAAAAAAAAANNAARSNGSELLSFQHNNSANESSFAIGNAASCVGVGVGNTSVDAGNAAAGGAAGAAAGTIGLFNAHELAHALDADANRDKLRREHYHQHVSASAPVSVNRSESYKERVLNKRYRNSHRKTSDPSLNAQQQPNDEQQTAQQHQQQQPDLALTNSNYTASSNSSLSSGGGGGGGSESPSTSMEQVGVGGGGGGAAATATATTNAVAWQQQHTHAHTPQHQQHQHQHHQHHHHQHQHQHHHHVPSQQQQHHSHHNHSHSHGGNATWQQESFQSSTSSNASFWAGQPLGQSNFESDDDDDAANETLCWSALVSQEILTTLDDGAKKRQEIINEIYQTERKHVRILKLLDGLFYASLYESNLLPTDLCTILSPPAPLREFHSNFEQKLKQRRLEHNYIVGNIGDLLSEMFDSASGEELREHGVQYCGRQQIALAAIKERRRKDEQLHKLLNKLESHKACRRLHIQDIMPAVWQRLTKYPMLFENLYKLTVRVMPEERAEAQAIQSALEACKKILVDVNKAVRTAEDAHKLQNIQRKLDKSTFDKDEFKNLDFTRYRLIHDGNLTMKKNPNIQLYGLLFENMIVLLTKQDDKYSLKYLHAALAVNNKPVNPIMSIDSDFLVRQEAADKNSFFLITTKTSQMLELRAPSSSECKTWFKHISDAAEQYKTRSKSNNAINNNNNNNNSSSSNNNSNSGGGNHETSADETISASASASAFLPHSHTRETLELTTERPAPVAAHATASTNNPLAPMLSLSTSTPPVSSNQQQYQQHYQHYQQQQQQQQQLPHSGRRESTPAVTPVDNGGYYNLGKKRFSHNELLPPDCAAAVNRTMSTRSCGDAPTSNSDALPLRHTQSARTATSAGAGVGDNASKRDSTSIVYSNNSNDTRTLLMQSPLVDPATIQISISPAHTAEPVLTPAERLRRLDASIRDGLQAKQQIICDMFRLPVEHYHEIVDIAMMPEAPKDSADIALAAYDQVQSLTKILNEYIQVAQEAEISAVSTAVCDHCHEKQHQQQQQQRKSNVNALRSGGGGSGKVAASAPPAAADVPPPLPPPNRQQAQAQQRLPTKQRGGGVPPSSNNKHVKHANAHLLERSDPVSIHEDDDGYCEIDELRLPALPMPLPLPLPPQSKVPGTACPLVAQLKAPPPRPATPPTSTTTTTTTPLVNAVAVAAAVAAVVAPVSSAQPTAPAPAPELIKRQSVMSADSIPEESVDELTKALVDEKLQSIEKDDDDGTVAAQSEAEPAAADETTSQIKAKTNAEEHESIVVETLDENEDEDEQTLVEVKKPEDEEEEEASAAAQPEQAKATEAPAETQQSPMAEALQPASGVASDVQTLTTQSTAEPQHQKSVEVKSDAAVEDAKDAQDAQDVCDTLVALNKAQSKLSMIDNSTQTTQPLILAVTSISATATGSNNSNNSNNNGGGVGGNKTTVGSKTHASCCGPNRLQHANSLEPSVPCYALSGIVTALNEQISLLLPKINERDAERERLRKENQHLRELLSAMHNRQRVETRLPTPININTTNSNALSGSAAAAAAAAAAEESNDDEVDSASIKTLTPTPAATSPTTSDNNTVVAAASTTPAAADDEAKAAPTAEAAAAAAAEAATATAAESKPEAD